MIKSGTAKMDKIIRYSDMVSARNTQQAANSGNSNNQPVEDFTSDCMNILGVIFAMCALMMKMKYCAWGALYCSCISFTNMKSNDDPKQIMSSFMLSISAVVMSYLQDPQPMTLLGAS